MTDRAFRDPSDDRDVRLAGESVALNAYVVEINPPAGRREWLYIDKRTGNITRREYVERRRRYVSTYDDYRAVEGSPNRRASAPPIHSGNEREADLGYPRARRDA